jgi:cytochrome oxidase Cu insertion factor (SCO1/SenC/PrrC family)
MSDQPARRPVPPTIWLAAFLVAAALIGGAYLLLKSTPPPQIAAAPDRVAQVPAFELLDQRGDTVTDSSLAGKIWVANFIFTRCKGPCPIVTSRMLELDTKLKKVRDSVTLVSFTVDPEFDTPDVLAAHGKALGANPDNWKFLTGPRDVIEPLIVQGLLQPLAKEPDGTPAHSTRMVLVDSDGWIRGFRDGMDPEAVQKLVMDIGALLREPTSDSP